MRVPDHDALFEGLGQRERRRRDAAGSPAGAHPIPDAAHGGDEVGRARVVGELAAQIGDVDVDEVVVAEPVLAPDALEQLGAARTRRAARRSACRAGRTRCG